MGLQRIYINKLPISINSLIRQFTNKITLLSKLSITRNSSIIVFGIIISNLLGYVFHIIVGRALGPADYGEFGALISLYLIIALPASALSSAVTKYSAKYNAKKEFSKIGALRNSLGRKTLIFGIFLFFVIVVLSIPLSGYLKVSASSIIIVGITLIFSLILPINRGVLQGMKKFKILSVNNILEAAFRLALAFVFIFLGFKANGAVLAYGLAYLLAFIFIFPYIKETKSGENLEKSELGKIYKFVFIVLIANLVIQLIINLPTLFIKHAYSAEFTGLWTAALTLARVSLFVTGGITIVMFPEVAEKDNHKDKKAVFNKALLLTLVVSVGAALCFILFGNLAITILYGKTYLSAVPILEWMGLAMIPLGILQLWVNYLVAGR